MFAPEALRQNAAWNLRRNVAYVERWQNHALKFLWPIEPRAILDDAITNIKQEKKILEKGSEDNNVVAMTYRMVRFLRLNVVAMQIIIIFEWTNRFVDFIRQIQIDGCFDHLRDGHR